MVDSKNYTQVIDAFLAALRSQNQGSTFAALLIGSVARGMQTPRSDLDLLIVSPAVMKTPRTFDRLHVQALTEGEFLARLRRGDDFAAWCVRFGVPLVVSEGWRAIASSEEAAIWPDWRKKIIHGARRLLLASSLSKLGDDDAAEEEILYAVSHTARAILLREGTFPLSRPEVVTQLQERGHRSLAEMLKQLLYDGLTSRTLGQALMYVKKVLVGLDREVYRAFVTEHRQTTIGKVRPEALA